MKTSKETFAVRRERESTEGKYVIHEKNSWKDKREEGNGRYNKITQK